MAAPSLPKSAPPTELLNKEKKEKKEKKEGHKHKEHKDKTGTDKKEKKHPHVRIHILAMPAVARLPRKPARFLTVHL